jgi:hypothetical protein
MSNQIQPDAQNYPDKPDIATLQQMHDPLIQVTKILQDGTGKNRKSALIINGGTGLGFKDILALQDRLLDTKTFPKGGPGLYEFDVTDQGSGAKSFWRVRLGGSDDSAPMAGELRIPMTASGQPLGSAGPAPARGVAALPTFRSPAPLSPESEDLGNGLIYNSKFHLLTYPDGSVYKWSPDQPLPHLAAQASAQQASTPVGASVFGGASPVGAPNPEVAELRAALTGVQTVLAKTQEEAREAQRQRELADERARHEKELVLLREAGEKQINELRDMMKALAAKPAEDPRIAALEAERRERTLLDAQRDREAATRAEMDRKFDALTASLRELGSNKTEPMVTLLTTIMAQQTAQSQENLRLLKESGSAALATAQQSALTPERHMAMLREIREMSENSGSSIINEKMLAVFSNMLDMVTRFNQSQNSGESTWMDLAREALDKGGTMVSKFAEVSARKAAAVTAQAQSTAVQAASAARVAEANARRLPPAPAAPGAPAAAKSATEQERDALAAAMDKADGVKPAATTAADGGATVTPIKKGRKGAAPAVPTVNPVVNATVEELRGIFGEIADAEFFGSTMELIENLRKGYAEDPNSVAPDDVAQYVFDAKAQLQEIVRASKGKPPVALEMLGYGKFEYLFERMLPDADEAFWTDAATALRAKVAAERAAAPTG